MAALNVLLRPDAYYAEVDGGVYFISHQGETFIAGPTVHQWLDRLAPLLDGTRTLDRLTAGLPADRAAFVTKLVGVLAERGLVRMVGPGTPDTLTDAERHEYRGLLSYLGYFSDSPGHVLENVLDTPTVIIGSDPLAAELSRACAAAGLRKVEMADEVGTAQVVVHVADRAEPERAVRLERLCAASGALLAQVMPVADGIWWQPAARGGGLASAWRRHRALAGPVPAAGPPDPVAAKVVANQVAHDVFRLLTGLREETAPRLVVFDPRTMASTTHPIIPHPLDLPAEPLDEAAFLDRITSLRTAPAVSEEEFSRRAKGLMDGRTGLFAEIDEGDLAQLPLHVTATTVSDPCGRLGDAPRPVVTGAGFTFEEARYRAALAALARAGTLTLDERRLIDGHVHAYDLVDHTARLVPAETVFGASRGAAAAYSWDEAVAAGLTAHAAALTLDGIAHVTEPFGRVDLTEAPEYCLAMIRALGEKPAVYDVTGPLGAPTVVGTLSGGATACGAALTIEAAVAACLRDLLLVRQAEINDQPVYAPAPCAPPSPALQGDHLAPRRPGTDVPTLVARLAEQGRRPLAVPLDHDPAVHAALPFVVQVVC
ncbi:hypothetical protein DYH53_26700 [Klebsiella pneumoniae subsp. pneumoniae]|uniref:PbtF n=2 Tax=Planobispora rosea TaxID=35762 RepID=U5Q0A7_PLARO|nr:hypothetical protein [Planobispora rosea]AGY49592.1 PbtF [Planobispora rosea]MVB68392.1 hypothetical protein [Klebsiella pneumoniae subsp. pneumoniae]GGS80308.1 hypothetical protein GCM10010156_43840 [Planobispora rosea]GIH86025.1 hypothetical protein Pro02_44330 [Planobispora rosea]